MLSAWDKYGVQASSFNEDPHSEVACHDCHGGDPTETDKDLSHANAATSDPADSVIADPSVDIAACGQCHAQLASVNETSLHSTFHGYETLFETRAGYDFDSHPHIEEEFGAECGACHTTCGQCHVSFPNSVKGGLMEGHQFKAIPNTLLKTEFKQVCTACHSSRIEEEFYVLGAMASVPGYRIDAHYYQGYRCTTCHTGAEMHGNGTLYGTRYETPDMPRCEDCHGTVTFDDASVAFGSAGDNAYHQQHGVASSAGDPVFQCQVCHSQDYKNCNACHVAGAGITGDPYVTFEIGKNPLTMERPDYDYVVLRHIPISPDTYEPWGESSLANFEALPSWKYASPHNIQRFTSRTDTTGGLNDGLDGCRSCHNGSTGDGSDWFLRQADVDSLDAVMADSLGIDPREIEANSPLVVDDNIPSTIN